MVQLTPKQRQVYKQQDQILSLFKKRKNFPFVLSGGTALSRFYLHHRFSEDLDFFCEEPDFSFAKVELLMRGIGPFEMIGQTNLPSRLKVASYAAGKGLKIKVDFLEDPFSGMWNPTLKKAESGLTFRVDSIEQIFYRKFYSLLEQYHQTNTITRFKDIIDLYTLHSHYKKIGKVFDYYRKHNVSMNEEKIILIFGQITKKQVQEGLNLIKVDASSEEIYRTLKEVSKKLMREGVAS
ncbi:MAG TPA: hypothetical protein DDW49_05095 [Deltaproteobacteria bacterium]|nr:MAG: hypothetical protein A2048_04345 [Deltaproteobacteria bacterium GWA2_45_12]HBF12752.1 hypothetical protein [Deltaproteobacteria bacterium]